MSDAMTQARKFISEHRHSIKLQLLADAENELAALLTETRTKALEEAAAAIPTNWCDSLLSGKYGTPIPATRPDIERLLHGISARIRAKAEGGEK